MFLAGSFLGLSTFQSIEGTNIPLRKTYSKVRVYGNSIIDKLQIKNIEMSDSELQNIIMTDNLIWDANTLLMAEFENDLVAGNIADLTNPIIKWQVNRREVGGSTLKALDIVDVGISEYVDYSAQHGKNYIYSLFATSENEQSEPLECEEIETDFFGYYLVDEEEGKVFKFDLNVQSGTKQYQEDVTIMDNYTEYPSIAMGKRKYFTSSISCICGTVSINGQLQQSNEYVSELRNYILNGKKKIFKTRKGEIYKVFTSNYSEQQLDDGIKEQVILISFNLTEVGEV